MNRRDWLKKTSIALAGGLILGDAALELFEKLTHRKVFALGGLPDQHLWGLSTSTYPEWSQTGRITAINNGTLTIQFDPPHGPSDWKVMANPQSQIRVNRTDIFAVGDPIAILRS